jgi:predicted nucleic acid-binding protein
MMLYLDTSALVKCYFKERGTDVVIGRAIEPDQEVFTSIVTFAEVHSVMARKFREGQINSNEWGKAREAFEADWAVLLNIIGLDLQTMAELPKLMEQYSSGPRGPFLQPLDAIHLSAAIWLSETAKFQIPRRSSEGLEFGVADRGLARIADKCGLRVFNPEEEN